MKKFPQLMVSDISTDVLGAESTILMNNQRDKLLSNEHVLLNPCIDNPSMLLSGLKDAVAANLIKRTGAKEKIPMVLAYWPKHQQIVH